MINNEKLGYTLKPFQVVVMALAALLSGVAGLLSLPYTLKVIFIAIFGATFFITLGAFIQSMRLPGYGIISWYLTRDTRDVREFLQKYVEKTIQGGGVIEIDCMGIKLGTVSDFLHSTISLYDWKTARIRYLILKTGSSGAEAREEIEVRPRIDYSTAKGLEEAQQLKSLFKQQWTECNFEIKLFEFLPSFYIIRVNDYMLVGLYLRQKGRNCPYLILKAGPDTYFSNFKDYFDRFFDSDLSEKIAKTV